MKIGKVALTVVVAVVVGMVAFSLSKHFIIDPPVSITMRVGFLSDYVLQVNNLSATEGVEVYVQVKNGRASARSANVVIPPNGTAEFGALEMNWNFQTGDYGYVLPVRYGKKLFFRKCRGRRYETWFGWFGD